jgi:hypothetical protein
MEQGHSRKTVIRMPMALIFTLLMQAAVILIWATQLDARVNGVEQQMLGNHGLNEKFAKLEERLDDVKQGMGDIKRQIEQLTQNLLK